MNNVNCYMAIQKVRMNDRFDYLCDTPEKYNDVICHFFILQPLVENFFNYVVEPREMKIHIILRATDDGKDVIIGITASGDGISAEDIKHILSGDQNWQKGCIGINNIKNRLQLLFGENYGLQITSTHKPMCGTTVKLRFPLLAACYRSLSVYNIT